ncbi:MAG TPA: serine/threonine-protein kinase [Polyangia bacterium]|nr:serine/threonine-protein kinase [Polyangia bacterium]
MMSAGEALEQGKATPRERLGRYELIEQLGVGGMAEIFKARATGPGGFQRTVVVKRILPANCSDPSFVRMFVAEAKILGMLHHPNVIQAYDFGESGGTLFLVLEYVDGPSLAETVSVLKEAGRQMPVGVACQIGHDVCRALDHVHNLLDADGAALNVVHRDVTPSNVLLTATGTAKLLDFGVAKYRASQARSQVGTIKGKPAYLAPETLDQRDVDHRTDIFSLGIVLHELLTLQPLFEGDNHQITFYRVLNMEIPPPSQVRPEIPPELDRIVLKALERERDKRYQSAQDMARDLDAFLASQAFRSEDAIAFVQELAGLIAARQPPEIPSFDQLSGRADQTQETEPGAPNRATTDTETAATVPGKGTRSYFSERFRTSRVGRFLLGRSRDE